MLLTYFKNPLNLKIERNFCFKFVRTSDFCGWFNKIMKPCVIPDRFFSQFLSAQQLAYMIVTLKIQRWNRDATYPCLV